MAIGASRFKLPAPLPPPRASVLGAPNPAGYQNYFDFNFQDMLGCCFRPPDNPGFQTWTWYQNGWGMDVATFNNNSGCHLPLNATQWTNYFQSVNKPHGAWIFYNDKRQDYFGIGCVSSEGVSGAGDADALWACKYAEALEQWPSQNFAMPAGDAKFWFDENNVFCAVNASGYRRRLDVDVDQSQQRSRSRRHHGFQRHLGWAGRGWFL